MKKSVKIIISVLAIVLICAISFDVLLVNNSKQETPANTTQNIENQATESEEKTYSNPVEAQARKMVENMTLYEKVGQMLLYYIPKEEPLKKMARWQFGGYILFSRNFQNSTPANTRSEIEEYCKQNGLNPNFDSSNNNNNYARNFIRNEVLPKFKQINSNYEDALNSLSILAFEEEQIIKEYIKSLDLYENDKILSQKFKNLSTQMQKRIVYEIYVKHDFEYTQERILNTLKFINENITSKSGKKCSINATHWLFVNEKHIEVLTNQIKNTNVLKITSEGTYKFGDYEFSIKKNQEKFQKFPNDSDFKAYIELKEPINFELRTRRDGDRITPLGSKGEMKLKKYLISKNIPQHEKDKIILLCKEGKILWVSGYGLCEDLKVVNSCTHVLTLKKSRLGGKLW